MKRSLAAAAFWASVLAVKHDVVVVDAFAPSTTDRKTSLTTRLHLLPEQGKQLEAAMNAAYARASALQEDSPGGKFEGETAVLPAKTSAAASTVNAATTIPAERPPLSASARAFVARVFSLPSSIIRGHPHPKLEGLSTWEESSHDNESASQDVVFFPLVGFQFVRDGPHHYRVLPSHKSVHAACRLPTRGQEEEVLVGWFSKACHLNPYQDDELYGQQPVAAAKQQQPSDDKNIR